MAARANFIRLLKENESVTFRGWWHPEWCERAILQVRSKDVIIAHPNKVDEDGNPIRVYMDFPKASQIEELDGNYFVLSFESDPEGKYSLEYCFPKSD